MKAVQVVSRGTASFVDCNEPSIQPNHALVRTCYLSLCGSDVQMLHHAADASYPFPPGTTGHEMVGIIEKLGSDDTTLSVGDRVLCLAPGHRAMCELYCAPVEHIVPLPNGVPLETLLQAQQLGTVLYGAKRLPDVAGKNVVVIGQGSAGLWFDFHLRRLGAKQVIALDIEPFRLERSLAFGATHTINNSENNANESVQDILEGALPDVVIEAAGEIDSINLAVDLVRKFGDILFFGYPRSQTFPFNFDALFHKCCRAATIVGASSEPGLESMREAVSLVASGEAQADLLITHRVRFDEVINAYEMHRTRSDGAVKIVIEMPGAA